MFVLVFQVNFGRKYRKRAKKCRKQVNLAKFYAARQFWVDRSTATGRPFLAEAQRRNVGHWHRGASNQVSNTKMNYFIPTPSLALIPTF